jgi:hypothetical protein
MKVIIIKIANYHSSLILLIYSINDPFSYDYLFFTIFPMPIAVLFYMSLILDCLIRFCFASKINPLNL